MHWVAFNLIRLLASGSHIYIEGADCVSINQDTSLGGNAQSWVLPMPLKQGKLKPNEEKPGG